MFEREDLERSIRRGIAQKEVNDNSLSILMFELFMISALITVASKSLLVFFLSMIGFFLLTMWKKTLILLIILFSLAWGAIGYSLFGWANSTPWIGATIFFIISFVIHIPAIDGVEQYS